MAPREDKVSAMEHMVTLYIQAQARVIFAVFLQRRRKQPCCGQCSVREKALHDTGSYFYLKEIGISSQEVFNSNTKDFQGYSRAKLKPKQKCLVRS